MSGKKLLYVAGLQAGGITDHLEKLLEYFSRHWEVILAVPGETGLYRFTLKHGIQSYQLNISGGLHPESDLRVSAKLLGICRKEKVDLLHAHGYKAALLTLPASGFYRCPVVVTVHNFPAYHQVSYLPLQCFNWGLKALDPLVKRYITVSDALRKMLLKLGIKASKIDTVYNGIDTRQFPIKQMNSSSSRSGEIKVGTVGRLVSQKGMDLFIQAAAEASQKFPNACFYIVGEGPEKNKLEKLKKSLDRHQNIKIMGSIHNVSQFLSSLNIFVLFSRSEGLSLSLLEAGSTGLPLVGAATGGIPEVIRHGKTGLLVQSENVFALKNAMVRLMENIDEREKMGAEAARDIRRRFEMGNMLQKTEEIYQQVLEERPGLLWAQ